MMPSSVKADITMALSTRVPRLGFLGLGWIGRRRLTSLLATDACEVAALSDSSEISLAAAHALAPDAPMASTLDALLAHDLDGLVIATPSGLHADQCLAALPRGVAVFCQKPLARTADETRRVLAAARTADRLLGIDYSYRHVAAFSHAAALVQSGVLGDLYAVDLTFHNAYGPDKGWCKDHALSGGGCLIDLGVHLIDFALLALANPSIDAVTAHRWSQGRPSRRASQDVEDFATGQFTTSSGITVRLACSWWSHIGQGASIEAQFHGTRGGVRVANVHGSFFDFVCERLQGDRSEVLIQPPDDWEGRALAAWTAQLTRSPRYDPAVESSLVVADVLDRMYAA